MPLVKRVIVESWNLEIGGEIKENLITHLSENNTVIPPKLQETHYLHTTHTSCQLPASCAAGKTEGVTADVTNMLHSHPHGKEGEYKLPASKYLSPQIQLNKLRLVYGSAYHDYHELKKNQLKRTGNF